MAIKSKRVKITPRERRKYRIRKHLSGSDARPRLSVFRSGKFTYGQVISDETGATLASGSTREAAVMEAVSRIEKEGMHSDKVSTKSTIAAKALGLILAERLKEKSIENLVFDRNGYLYHGRVQAVADGIREGGLKF